MFKTFGRHFSNGPLMLFLGYTLFGTVPLIVKYLSQMGLSAAQIVFVRFLLCSLFVVLVAIFKLQPLRAYNKRALFFRGLTGGVSVFLWFLALQFTTAAKGTLLSYTHSIWANVFNAVFLKQHPHRGFWPMLSLACLGVYLVLDPSMSAINLGDILALTAGAIAGVAVLTIKEARKTDNAISVFASFSWIGLATSVVFMLLPIAAGNEMSWSDVVHTPNAIELLVLMGVVSTVGQLLFTHGYGNASVALGTVLSLLVPILTACGESLLFGRSVTPQFIFGASLVLAACAISGGLERRDRILREEVI